MVFLLPAKYGAANIPLKAGATQRSGYAAKRA